jgi:hypothetical protein
LTVLKPILLVEDNPKDLELTLVALERGRLANEVVIARDGAEALDYLYCSTSSCRKWMGSRYSRRSSPTRTCSRSPS